MKNRYTHRHTTSQPFFHRVCALVLAITSAFSPTLSTAAGLFPGLIGRTVLPFVPPAGTLPQLLNPNDMVTTNGSLMTITQNGGKDKVIIDWSSFNVGSGALVRFYQGTGTPGTANWVPKSNYAALNRIYDLNPSVINGNLSADGRVYLINRNGVFFGPNASVQVQSLVASAFNISDANFKSGRLIFDSTSYDSNQTSPVSDSTTISNEGSITTNSGGSVFFVGPKIQNLGSISTPGGKINLVGLKANGQVEIKEIMETRDPQDVIYTDTSLAGDVANMKGGSLSGADGGWIGLQGNTVRNDGLIRAVTTRRQNGVIFLRAKDLVATGEGSVTDVDVSDASEAMGRNSLVFSPGVVAFGGLAGQGTNVLARVDHEGSITAHSGDVSIEAVDRVFLDEKSNIDVSGLSIVRPMSDQFIDAQLNSLYLRDDYGQKSGSLLLGSTVTVDVLKGSAVGNLSTYYLGMTKNAQDLSTVGGNITIGAPTNYTLTDTIISKGAGFNISGGKVTYSGGAPASTKVIASDGHVYDISSMPQWLTYTGILGTTIKSYGKFGSEKLNGISFGGHLMHLQANPADRTVGGSAGSLTLRSRVIEGLDDDLNLQASVTTGFNQTVTTPHLDTDGSAAPDSPEYRRYLNYLISLNRGLEAPKGGKLVIGNELSNTLGSLVTFEEDAAVSSVAVNKSFVSTAPVSGWDGALLNIDTPTEISAAMISRLKLGGLAIYANTSIKTEKDAEIVLRPGGSTWISTGKTDKDGNEILRTGGSYNATARRIEFLGAVSAPGGSVDMMIRPNISSYGTSQDNQLYRQIAETIYLGNDSRISTAGERIDNSLFGLSPLDMRNGGFTAGGSISLRQLSLSGVTGFALTQNNENSIVVNDGALLDVSGGYLIDAKGVVSGGNAGSLTLKAPTISLGGELRGFSLPGKDGGEVILHAQEVQVAAQGKQFDNGFGINDLVPVDLVGKLVLGADRFQNSGFSRINLSATDNLTVDPGVQLTPSIVKSVTPGKTKATGSTCSSGECFSTSYPTFLDQIGKTYLSLNAGKNVYDSANVDPSGNTVPLNQLAKLTITQGAAVTTAPGGAITLSAPLIDIAGTVSTPGGSVTAKSATANGSVTVRSTGKILAAGYNKVGIATKVDQPAPLPVPKTGGTVSLEASGGTLDLQAGSLVDVSGSERIEGEVRNSHGLLTSVSVAGDAGSLSLAYGIDMHLNGTIAGAGKMTGTRNGSLSVKNTSGDLTLNAGDVDRYQGSGFDALTFSSSTRINIPANLHLSVGRSLTLDSPLIQGIEGIENSVTIQAPWIKLVNTGAIAASLPGAAADAVSGTVSFLGGYLDVQGSLLMKGFSGVNMTADHDLTFADRTYTDSAGKAFWSGALGTTAANLTLQASRIYPTTASKFTITTPGKTTILPGAVDTTPIYSAGGSLTIAANSGIDQRGYLAAPLGDITLDSGAGRVDLAEGSVTTTAGSASVAYGTYDSSTWQVKYLSDTDKGTEVTAAPTKSITLKGNEVVVRDGAIQDLSGGGSVYASYWQPGLAGTYNPLRVSGRYVIVPDGSATRPGDSVYLEAMPSLGLKAGVYSILPIEYAFVPGALVIQDTGMQLLAGQRTLSKERYPVVGGYMTVRDTSVASQVYKGFSVRRAEDVIKEGDFTVKRFSGGDGGNFTLDASSGAYFGGTLTINPLAGYKGGTATFDARNVEIMNSVARPDFSQPLSDTLQLAGDKLSSLPVRELRLGDKDSTIDVTVQDGVSLKASSVTLSARDSVTLKDGSLVEATGGTGDYASIVTPSGTFALGDGAQLKSAGGIKLDVEDTLLNSNGIMDAGMDGYFSLTTNRIIFDDARMGVADGSYHMTGIREDTFRKYKNLTIASRGDMEFQRDVNLITGGSLTLDAARYLSTTNLDTTSISFTSKDMTLLNSEKSFSPALTGTDALVGTGGSLNFNADSITVAPRLDGTRGNIAFDRFKTTSINSTNDLVFKGEGTIATKGTGDLNLSAARVTTSADTYKADGSTTVANITIDGRNGAVTLNGSQKNGTAGTTSTPGGNLQILGNSITQTDGLLDVAAGQIGLAATGNVAINGTIKATGSEQTAASGEKVYYSGGKITLQSDNGKVELQSGSRLDVSAAAQGDAGSVVLSAKTADKGGVIKDAAAKLTGNAGSGGKGGSFSIDSATLDGSAGLDGLSSTLASGGFNNLVNIRSRSGDLALTNGNTLSGREVVVAADNGAIAVGGAINADTNDGSGQIELYSGTALTLQSGSTLSARGKAIGANGGTVILSSLDGSDNAKTFNGVYALNVNSGSTIDVSSGGGSGTGGTVAFRSYQGKKQAGDTSLNDVNIGAVNGTITGASRVSVEAVRAYTNMTTVGDITAYANDATTFMADSATAETKNRLFVTNDPVNHLQAGIEISSAANTDLTFDTAWDLKTIRPGGEAGVVTLKSARNLNVNQNLSDAPTPLNTIRQSTLVDSWGINLIADSDNGADYRSVNKGSALTSGSGNLAIAVGKVVYSENAPIHIAAGNDATMNGWSVATGPGYMVNVDMKYNLGSYGGAIRGDVGRDLNLTSAGSAIQSALGNIDISTGRDLNLGSLANTGAIRTTGEFDDSVLVAKQPGMAANVVANRKSYWTYHNGGSINLDVGKAVNGNLSITNGWDGAYIDSSLYSYINDNNGVPKATTVAYPWYLAAGFGGSRESGQTGTANIPVTVGIATMGGGDVSVRSGGSLLTQIGAFGKGDVAVTTGGDMTGRFRVMNGVATLSSGGSFGTNASPVVTELAAAQLSVAAMGDVRLGSVQNPDNSRDRIFFGSLSQLLWNMTYTQNSSFSATSLSGNTTLYGLNQYANYSMPSGVLAFRKYILPASFELSAAGDINVMNHFVLAPSETGNLGLFAGGSIRGDLDSNGTLLGGFKIQDVDIASMYGRQVDKGGNVHYSLLSGPIHTGINHLTDTEPVRVIAGNDIANLDLYLNKPAEVTAIDGDITRLNFIGQNITPQGLTSIKAGGNIDQGITVGGSKPTIEVGGPGTLLVQAGGNIQLGNSGGINSVGNTYNGSFSGAGKDTDSDLIVSAGANSGASMTQQDVKDFFADIRIASDELASLKADGKTAEADVLLEKTEKKISKYFYTYDSGKAGTGNLELVDSAISSRMGSIYAMAGSNMNVGKTALSNAPLKSSGITTLYGGELAVYAGNDINVNESRIMTYLGGDITVWSDQGDINAGRGSKTVVSAPTPLYNYDPANPDVLTSITFTPPSAGSGIRALTFDPDGSGPLDAQPAGDIHIYAKGTLDAGEAGIQGNKLFLVASAFSNSQNIVAGAGSVGVPVSNQNSISIGPMTGATDMTSDKKMIETISGGGESSKKSALTEAEDFLMKYLDVKVIELGEGSL